MARDVPDCAWMRRKEKHEETHQRRTYDLASRIGGREGRREEGEGLKAFIRQHIEDHERAHEELAAKLGAGTRQNAKGITLLGRRARKRRIFKKK